MKKRSLLTGYLLAITAIFPLFFFPYLREQFLLAKNLFLAAAVLFGLIIWAVTLWQEKEPKVYLGGADGLLLIFSLFLGGYLFFLSPGNRYEALLSQPAVGAFWFLSLYSFLLGQTDLRSKPSKLFLALLISGGIVSLIAAVLFALPDSRYPLRIGGENSGLMIGNSLWSPVGSIIEALWLLVPTAVFAIVSFVRQGEKESSRRWPIFGLAVLLLVGAGVGAYQLLNNRNVPLLNVSSSWGVVAETFKRRPFFGLGPASFGEAFTIFKQPEFNASKWWTTRFSRPNGTYLLWWAETGLAGLVFLGLVLFRSWQKSKAKLALRLSLLALILMGLFLPSAMMFSFMLIIFLALLWERREVALPAPKISLQIIAGLVLVLTLATGYFWQRAARAEFLFYRFVRGMAAGKVSDPDYYQAVKLNPYAAEFRILRSQLDISVLSNLLQSTKAEEMNDQKKQQISLLAQEGINEAKAAAALRPRYVYAWENLAQTYRQLINVAQGADQWTLSAYQQAISLDPYNPRLRVDFGGVLYSLNSFEQAGRSFEAAVQMKQDYPNAWYNWAWSLRQQNKIDEAVQRMQQVLYLVEPSSPDFEKAQADLDEWKKLLTKEEKKPAAEGQPKELTQPQPLPSPKVEEPIQLPQEAAPELQITPGVEQPAGENQPLP